MKQVSSHRRVVCSVATMRALEARGQWVSETSVDPDYPACPSAAPSTPDYDTTSRPGLDAPRRPRDRRRAGPVGSPHRRCPALPLC
jgi:hypothetical protein